MAPTGSEVVPLRLPVPEAGQLPPPVALQVQVAPLSCAGMVSAMVTLVALSGPALEATSV